MSRQAMEWALETRVGDPTRSLILVAIGKGANRDGEGSWASPETLGQYAECSERTVQRHIAVLIEGGLIREGDQTIIPAYIPKRRRPIVYDLAMDLETAALWATSERHGRRVAAEVAGAAAGRKGAPRRAEKRAESRAASAAWGDSHDTPPERARGDAHDTPRGTGDSNDTPSSASDGTLWGDTWGVKWGDTGDTQTREEQEKNQNQGQNMGADKRRATRPRTTKTNTLAPEDFAITDAMRAWATEKRLTVDIDAATEEFLENHRAKGTSFRDWTAGWRTWMLRTRQYGGPPPAVAQEGNGRRVNGNRRESMDDVVARNRIRYEQMKEAEKAAKRAPMGELT